MAKLIIIRGNSGSGKSTIAQALRERLPGRTALIEQDHFRRIVLKEKDIDCGDNIDLIAQTVDFAMARDYNVILEGILASSRYGKMLRELTEAWKDRHIYYLDVSFEETLKRHATRPSRLEFCEAEMRTWWRERDLTGLAGEKVIPEQYSLDQCVEYILQDITADPRPRGGAENDWVSGA